MPQEDGSEDETSGTKLTRRRDGDQPSTAAASSHGEIPKKPSLWADSANQTESLLRPEAIPHSKNNNEETTRGPGGSTRRTKEGKGSSFAAAALLTIQSQTPTKTKRRRRGYEGTEKRNDKIHWDGNGAGD